MGMQQILSIRRESRILFLLCACVTLPSSISHKLLGAATPEGLRRYVAFTEEEKYKALMMGALVTNECKHLSVVFCNAETGGELGLREDIQVFLMDQGANTQVFANSLEQTNNLTGRGIKIAVLDTGYNYLHPELASSYLGGWDFYNNDEDPIDDNGHGTHVAGLITADGLNNGARGVAPGTGILVAKIFSADGQGYFSDVVRAVYWIVDGPDETFGTADDFNVSAMSMSIGTSAPFSYLSGNCDSVLPELTDCLRYAREHGVLSIVAAGNSNGSGVSMPGCITYSTTIGAVDGANNLTFFSGRGDMVELVAPGWNLFSTYLGGSYINLSGTSMSTPVVSGVVALLKEAFPYATPDDVETALFRGAQDLGQSGRDTQYGYGLVRADRSLEELAKMCANLSVSVSNSFTYVSWTARATNFVLQVRTGLENGGWSPVTNAIVTNNGINTLQEATSQTSKFYRLRSLLAP